jgi:hypothetical protein
MLMGRMQPPADGEHITSWSTVARDLENRRPYSGDCTVHGKDGVADLNPGDGQTSCEVTR